MKNIIKKSFSIIAALFMLGACLGKYDFISLNAKALEGEKAVIWVVGDSTVSSFNDKYYYPRYGYGTQIGNYFDADKYEVKNLALSGRSSKSYILDPEYKTLLEGMKDGDFLIIGFGHNDEKFEKERYTSPNGDYKKEGTFQNSLYENYIKKAKDKGCTPILCTPIVRRTDGDSFSNSQLHITATEGEYEGGDYPEAVRDLGQALDIPVVDMTELTKSLYEALGSSNTLYLHAWTSSNKSSVDNTHTNIWGGKYNAYLLSKAIKELNINGLSEGVIDSAIAEEPSKEGNLVQNPDYVEFKYNSNLKNSEFWSDFGIWKGSVFGNIGEPVGKENFTLGTDENGNMNISVRKNKGKIASTVDGLAMYYYKVPSKSTFTLTAAVKVNSFTVNNQVSFGLMARDDMYIDEYTQNALGDYVACAPLNLKSNSVWNSFARKSGVLTQGSTFNNTTFNEGSLVDLKIQSSFDGYTCTIGNEDAVAKGFDFPLTSIDPDYVYVGMFASRNADVTFTNIKLIVDGKEISEDSLKLEDEINADEDLKKEEQAEDEDKDAGTEDIHGNHEEIKESSDGNIVETSDMSNADFLVTSLLLSIGGLIITRKR